VTTEATWAPRTHTRRRLDPLHRLDKTTLKLSPLMVRELALASGELGLTRAELVRLAIRYFLSSPAFEKLKLPRR
jgi:hypothetical protein